MSVALNDFFPHAYTTNWQLYELERRFFFISIHICIVQKLKMGAAFSFPSMQICKYIADREKKLEVTKTRVDWTDDRSFVLFDILITLTY